VGIGTFAVAITPDETHAYVANGGSNNVSVIGTASKTVVKSIQVGTWGVAVTPDGTHVYVSSSNSNDVSVIAGGQYPSVRTGPGGWPLGHDAFNLQSTVTASTF
jgi:YVTN family beta-propeller protein